MTKEEAIKEAYGEYWFEVRMFVNENGWFDKNSLYNNQFTFKYSDFDAQMIHKQDFCIPKSLQGLEDNNMWVKIESEDDLPKEKIDCFFINMERRIYIGNYEYGFFMHGRLGHSTTTITHYQPIQKPKPPIY